MRSFAREVHRAMGVLLVGAAVASVVAAQDIDASRAAELLKQSEAFRERAILEAKSRLRSMDHYADELKTAVVNRQGKASKGRRVFTTAKEKTDAIAALRTDRAEVERQLKLLEAKKGFPVPIFLVTGYRHGAFGTVPSIHVVQVIGPDSFRGEVVWYAVRNADAVVQVWVSGVDTSKLTDGSDIKLPEEMAFEIPATKTYATALGSQKTVLELRPIDLKKLAAHLKPGEELLPPAGTWRPPE